MPQPPFWRRDGGRLAPTLLAPFTPLTAWLTARRVARQGWAAPVPVVCCGNATVGGSGKTTLVLDLLPRLAARGFAPHALLRGYGGSAKGVRRVSPGDDAAETGDEALLLAAAAPTWTAADRAAGARAAIAAGARSVVMDDGLQNPTLRKNLALMVIDGGFGFGNGRLLPAGPLRESVAACAARCDAAVLIGADATGALAALPPDLPVLHAALEPGPATRALAGRRVLAFAGIGRPGKFFATLREAGVQVAGALSFPDHHRYGRSTLAYVLAHAGQLDALPVTTAKDAVRLPPDLRGKFAVADVALRWEREEDIASLLDALAAAAAA
ncbi:MAG: tetraacyldisaccharide 4'-kinase [Proteobacteria bacterium]|nr:tetraacyldisaccharide 4'-kinase [Pseudomonadota bacterium]